MTLNNRILFVQYSNDRNGSTLSGLLLADGFRDAGWETYAVFGSPGTMEVEYQKSGHKTFIVDHNNWLRRSHPGRFLHDVIYEWHKAARFANVFDQVLPHVVYINTAVSLAGAIAAKRKNIPCLWHLRELFKDVGGELDAPRLAKPLVRYFFNRFSLQIICNSHAVSENLLGNRYDNSVKVIPNAIEDIFFSNSISQTDARKKLGLPEKIGLIGVPGTLRPRKGHPFFIEAAAQLLERYPEIQIAITGSGEGKYVEHLKKTVIKSGIQKNVIFLGPINDMHFFYRACDIVCVPSEAESFGRCIIEAFASRVPVVATAAGGIPEIIDNNVDGVLVPYGDTYKLAITMERLITDEMFRQRLTNSAFQKAKNLYHEDELKETVCRLVHSVTNTRS